MDKNKCKSVLTTDSVGCKDVSLSKLENNPLFFYKLLECTMQDVLVNEQGFANASDFLYKAGHQAGLTLAAKFLNFKQDFTGFSMQLGELLRDNLLGIFAVEEFNEENSKFIFTISEDPERTGFCKHEGSIVSRYAEGLIAGIMEAYMGVKLDVNEVDCWARGTGRCRFRGAPVTGKKEKHMI